MSEKIEIEFTASYLVEIGKKVFLRIVFSKNNISVKQQLSIFDKSLWGVLIFFTAGVIFTIASIQSSSSIYLKALFALFGLALIFGAILTIIRQATDYLFISRDSICFKHNLKQRKVDPARNLTAVINMYQVKRHKTSGVDHTIFIIKLKSLEDNIPILSFQMEKSKEDEGLYLAKGIKDIINYTLWEGELPCLLP